MKYVLIQGTYSTEEESYIGYGIDCIEDKTLSFENLTTKQEPVAELVRLCNNLDLSSVHIMDVVEDFLIEST